MKFAVWITDVAIHRRHLVVGVTLLATLLLAALATLPSVWPKSFPALHGVTVDTDPENMLSADEAARVFHGRMKQQFALSDMVVVGVVDESNSVGVFTQETLAHVHDLAAYAKTLRWTRADGTSEGVVAVDLIAPSTVDDISQAGLGTVRFEWLMPEPPQNAEAALAVRDRALRLPFLNGTLVSEDGKALALYVPLTDKHLSYRVGQLLRERIATYGGTARYHLTGLPIAEDTFGVEMFVQMAISAPLAMLVIFLLMLWFFRRMALVTGPMLVAMVSVIVTMGLLIAAGHPVHIMSSMIPIFIMPIAVLDSVHMLSEFFDRYQATRDRAQTMRTVLHELFLPMLYTSLTSAAGFGSLALTPIPPVQVFGLYVAIGIGVAWVLTITFIPAYVMFLPERVFANFGAAHDTESHSWLARFLRGLGPFTVKRSKTIVAASVVLLGVAAYGITRIEINDNPVKWFAKGHEIRVADAVLNRHFAGTYMAHLALTAPDEAYDAARFQKQLVARLQAAAVDLAKDEQALAAGCNALVAQVPAAAGASSAAAALEVLDRIAAEQAAQATGDAADAWQEARKVLSAERQSGEVCKDPAVLRWMVALQEHLRQSGRVGKSSSLADLVQTVHRELFLGEAREYRIPDRREAVAQCLLTYQSSHRPDDLWHFVTPDFRQTNLWLQLTSGDNRDMAAVHTTVDQFVAKNPPPVPLAVEWFGLTHINVVWQEKMVVGMLESLAGAFVMVFVLMVVLFRSFWWGLLAMLPLSITIAIVYGAVGLLGKSYDMPVAVLSSLALGLAVDFAIHLLARARTVHQRTGSWQASLPYMFDEPARAITRNVIVVAVGFLPLLFAPLVPYQTVGVLLAAILGVSGVVTMLLLPAVIHLGERFLFRTRGAASAPAETENS